MTSLDEEEGVTEGVADKAVAMVKEYLEKLLDEHSNLFSSAFLHKAVDILDNVRPHPHVACIISVSFFSYQELFPCLLYETFVHACGTYCIHVCFVFCHNLEQ